MVVVVVVAVLIEHMMLVVVAVAVGGATESCINLITAVGTGNGPDTSPPISILFGATAKSA